MPQTIALSANLDLRAAAPLRETLLGCAEEAVELDGAGVTRLGGLCLQVLLAALRDWSARGLAFTVKDPSAAFLETLSLFGASEAMAPALSPQGAS